MAPLRPAGSALPTYNDSLNKGGGYGGGTLQSAGTRRTLKPTGGTNSGVQSPASKAAFDSMNIGATQARGLGGQAQPAPGQQAPGAAPGAAPYSPTTDLTPGQDANYNEWFANNDQVGQKMMDLASQQAALGNRKAAYLASMSGGSGGFYQSGQIAAGIAGQNMLQQGLLQNAQARGDIYNDKSAALGSLGIGAQGYGNNMGYRAYDRANELQDQGNDAGTAYVSDIIAGANSRWANRLKDWGAGSAGRTTFNTLEQKVKAALAAVPPGADPSKDPAVQKAIADLNAFNGDLYDKKGNLK